MSDKDSTNLNIRKSRPTALSATAFNANINSLGFNLDLISAHDPKTAADLAKIYAKVSKIKESDPLAPEEDYALFLEEFKKLLSIESDDQQPSQE